MLLKNNQPRMVFLGPGVNLKPGVNDVDDGVWKRFSGTRVVKSWIDSKQLEVVTSADGATVNSTAGTPLANLSNASKEDALRIVGETYDASLLGTFRSQTTDGEVQAAIDRQIAAVTPTPEELGTGGAIQPGNAEGTTSTADTRHRSSRKRE